MKKQIFAAMLAAMAVSASAEYVSPEQALERLGAGSRSGVKAELRQALKEVYVFENQDGFMFLPADDVAAPLLGYCESYEPEANPALKYMLDFYAREIEAVKGMPRVAAAAAGRPSRAPLATLVTTKWNQGAPFNNDCPYVGSKRSVTGCVATAFAQALKYFEYPTTGIGTHSYYWETGGETLEFDYGNTKFDWANMVDEYNGKTTYAQNNAVAKLMYACGVAVDMGYSPESSGAISINVIRALIENFGYDKGVYLDERDFYSLYDWEDIIYNEIAQGHPVCYSGAGDGGAHEFVVDGYSTDGFFHVNWGWGGMSDGFFLLSSMDPYTLGTGGGTGGFNASQTAVIGMQLPKEGSVEKEIVRCYDGFGPKVASANLGSKVAFNGAYRNGCLKNLTLSVAIKFEPLMGGEPVYAQWPYTPSELKTGWQFGDVEFKMPSVIAEEYYIMTPVYKLKDGTEWIDMPVQNNENNKRYCRVTDSKMIFMAEEPTIVNVKDFALAGKPEKAELTFDMAVECLYGFLSGSLDVRVSLGHMPLLTQKTSRLHVQKGGEVKTSVTIDFSELKDGEYRLQPYYDDVACGDVLKITISESGIEEISAERGPETVYDLQGRPVKGGLSRGIYIVGGKKQLVR